MGRRFKSLAEQEEFVKRRLIRPALHVLFRDLIRLECRVVRKIVSDQPLMSILPKDPSHMDAIRAVYGDYADLSRAKEVMDDGAELDTAQTEAFTTEVLVSRHTSAVTDDIISTPLEQGYCISTDPRILAQDYLVIDRKTLDTERDPTSKAHRVFQVESISTAGVTVEFYRRLNLIPVSRVPGADI